MSIVAPLAVALFSATAPQSPPVVVHRAGGEVLPFVDFAADLDRTTVLVGLGKLGGFRDGKRRRIKDSEAHVGSGSSVARVSGTQYYRVKSRSRLELDTVLRGAAGRKRLDLEFEVQLAKLPDGTLRRQIQPGPHGQIELAEGLDALWLVEPDPKRKRCHRVVQVVPRPKDMPRSKFAANMRDLLAINERLGQLKAAYETARRRRQHGDPPAAIRKTLDGVLAEGKVTLRQPENDRWSRSALAPWRRRLQEF